MYAIHLPLLYILYAIVFTYFPGVNNKFPELISASFIILVVVLAYWFSFISEKKNNWLKQRLVKIFITKKPVNTELAGLNVETLILPLVQEGNNMEDKNFSS